MGQYRRMEGVKIAVRMCAACIVVVGLLVERGELEIPEIGV